MLNTKPVLSAKQITPLIEILILLVFFSFSAVVLSRIFAKAYNDSCLAHDINSATLAVSEYTEQIRAQDYRGASDFNFLEGFEKDDVRGLYYIYLDKNFKKTDQKYAYAKVSLENEIKTTVSGNLISGNLTCIRNDGTVLINIHTAVFCNENK